MSALPTRAQRAAGSRIVAWVLTGLAPAQPATMVLLAVRLTVGLGLALLAVAAAAMAGQTISNQLVVFGLCFGVCLPVGLVGGGHLAAALGRRLDAPTTCAVAGVAGGGLLAVVLLARISHALGAATGPVLAGGMAAWVLAAGALARGLGWQAERAAKLASRRRPIWIATGVMAVLALLALLPPRLLGPGPLALSLLIAGVLALIIGRSSPSRVPRGVRVALDAGALVLIVLGVVDASAYLQYLPYDLRSVVPAIVSNGAGALDRPSVLIYAQQVHHDFYLGPVNDVLHGRLMLIDTYSQYGAGVFYFLAVWFKLAPLGYGPLGLLAGALTALQYALAYAALRAAGLRPGLATVAMAAAILATVFAATGSVAFFPSTGGLRYGWVYLLIVVAVLGARQRAWAGRARAAELTILGISAVWSIEATVYALAVFVTVAGIKALTADGSPSARWRRLGRDLTWAAACCVGANLLLAVGTFAAAGRWPDWRPYLAFFGVYSGGNVGGLKLPLVHAWSAGFGVGTLYFASAVALATVLLRHPRLLCERRPALIAVGACTALGIATLTYWAGNSDPNSLRPVALPAIMITALLLGLAGDRHPLVARPLQVGALALGLWLASLLAIFAWPQTQAKWHRSALYQVLPGHGGLPANLRRLWRSPRIDPRSAEAEALLARRARRHEPVVVLTEPNLSVEILVRTRRSNALPIGDPLQDNLIARYRLPPIDRAIDQLKPNTLMLTQLQAPRLGAPLEARTPLESAALAHLRRRFDFQVLQTSPSGLSIVRLVLAFRAPRRRSAR